MTKINGESKNEKLKFAERHPRINALISLIVLMIMCILLYFFVRHVIMLVGNGIEKARDYLVRFVNTTDQVVVVAMITGSVSILGVIISSIIAKIVDYRMGIKKYLYDKREEPYKQFIEMIYQIMENSKKPKNEQMSNDEMVHMVSEFSKGLTLWGSNKVVRKWLKYRNNSLKYENKTDTLFDLEEIIYQIRKDVGLGRRMKKGDLLSFFINDIEKIIK